MCGISGVLGPQPPGSIENLDAALLHRGPDGGGVYRSPDGVVSLAMRRLAIIDVAGGDQPMVTDDGRHALVFNGEIFNAPVLRRELEADGVRFHSDHSDTEVLLQLLVRDGEAALPRLDGMFAFAFFDHAERRLLCARDRMGIKPFYYAQFDGRFAFASELKALRGLPGLSLEVDRQSLFDYLSLMYVPGERTMLAGVDRLAPGHLLRYDLATRRLQTHRWWRPEFRPSHGVSRGEWAERIRETLHASVRSWAASDVAIACSLSGGLDSSAIVGSLAGDGASVQTVSLGFQAPGEEAWNELLLARQVAEQWGTEHREIVLSPDDLLADLPAMVWALDEPYGGGLPSWSVFKCMSETVKVALTGTGGDELFGNYGKWLPMEGGVLRRLLAGDARAVDANRFRAAFFERFYYFTDTAKREVLADGGHGLRDTADTLYERFAAGGVLRDAVALTDLGTQLPEEFLMMTDRFSMAHSLEARTPFLANAMVELALAIPAAQRTARGDLKGLLREAVAPLLPPPLLNAPKRGFVIPLRLWLRGTLRPLVERLLAPRRLAAQGFLAPEFHGRYVAPHLAGAADHTNRVWAALMFQLWHQMFIETPATARPAMTLEIAAP